MKISLLSAAASLVGDELIPITQAGKTVKTRINDVGAIKINLAPDNFFELSGGNRSFEDSGFLFHVASMADGAWVDAFEHSYGRGAWSHTATANLQGYAINFGMGPGIEDGISAGDIISLAMLVKGSNISQVIKVAARFHGISPITYVGAQITFPDVATTGGEQVRLLENLAVPAGALGVTIYTFGAAPLATYHTLGLWAVRGKTIGGTPPARLSRAVFSKKVAASKVLADVKLTIENATANGILNTYELPGYEAYDATYVASGGGAQIAAQSQGLRFNQVSVWGGMNGAGVLRGYAVDVATASTHIPSAIDTLLFEKIVDWTNVVARRDERLDQIYTLPAGKELHILWVSNVPNNVLIARWTVAPSPSVPKMRFALTGAGNEAGIWNDTWYDGGVAFSTVPAVLSVASTSGAMTEPVAKIIPYFTIPGKVYAVVGTETNLYHDAVCSAHSAGINGLCAHSVSVVGPVGANRNRRYLTNLGAAAVGVHNMQAKLFDSAGTQIASRAFNLHVVAATPKGSAKNILMIGDSLNATAQITTPLQAKFEALGAVVPIFVGTLGTAPNKHEARGGRRFIDYATAPVISYRVQVAGVTSIGIGAVYSTGGINYTVSEINITSGTGNVLMTGASLPSMTGTLTKVSGSGDANVGYTGRVGESSNPFWNVGTGLMDIANYRSTNGIGLIDLVTIQLGINGRVKESYDDDASMLIEINAAKAICAAFIADNAAIKIIIELPSICGNTSDGFASNYGSIFSRAVTESNINNMRKAIIAAFGAGVYNANVHVGAAGCALDRYYGYARAVGAAAGRITADTHEYHLNAVHPAQPGSNQMADMQFAQIMAIL